MISDEARTRVAAFVTATTWAEAGQIIVNDTWLVSGEAAEVFAAMREEVEAKTREEDGGAAVGKVMAHLGSCLERLRERGPDEIVRLAALERRLLDAADADPAWQEAVDEELVQELALLLFRASLVHDAPRGARIERLRAAVRKRQAEDLLATAVNLMVRRDGERAELFARAQHAAHMAFTISKSLDEPRLQLVAAHELANAIASNPTTTPAGLAAAQTLYAGALEAADRDPAHEDVAISIRINLAQLLWRAQQGDEWTNRRRALELLREARDRLERRPRSPETDATCGRTLHNLGCFYVEAPFGNRSQNLDDALTALLAALELRPEGVDPVGRARTLRALAVVYPEASRPASRAEAHALAASARAEAEAIEARLATEQRPSPGRAAVERQRSALFDDELEDFAADPGNARALAAMVAHHERVLAEIDREREPLAWAEWTGGKAWLVRLQSVHEPRSLEDTAGGFAQALEVATVERAPRLRRRLLQCTGALYHGIGAWEGSLRAHGEAVVLGDAVVNGADSAAARRRELAIDRRLAILGAYAAARLGDAARAVELAELGRARLIVDELGVAELIESEADEALRVAARETLAGVHAAEEELAALERESPIGQAQGAIARLADFAGVDPSIAKIRVTDPGRFDAETHRREVAETEARLAALRVRLRELLREARAGEYGLAPAVLSAADVSRVAARAGMPVVYLLVTLWGGVAVAAFPDGALEIELLAQLTSDDTRRMLYGGDGYIDAAMLRGREKLQVALDAVEEKLAPSIAAVAAMVRRRGGDDVIFVPLGTIGLLPWHVVTHRAGLITRVAPSARSAALAVRAGARRGPALSVATIGPAKSNGFAALACAEIEVANVAHRFAAGAPTTALARSAATRDAVLAALDECTHLHVATHGTFRASDAMLSTLHLDGDETVFLRDLISSKGKRRPLQLAVLSACQSALSEYRVLPDELTSFPTALLLTGAASVVSTAWMVDDTAAAFFCFAFYEALVAEHRSPAAAVFSAQTWLRGATPPALLEAVATMRARIAASQREARRTLVELEDTLRSQPPGRPPFAESQHWGAFLYAGM
ncbi:MAG: CHAT domain-containing protein [Deltaproteobacteria bacterium]|nr:CHAT domain-containing protein [Deltaproteobacteria bacterium]